MALPERALVVSSLGGEPLLLEAWVVEQLRLWKDPVRAWEGEVTLTCSGTQIGLVRHRRRRSGYRSTNSVDLTPLWQRLLRLLQQALAAATRIREVLRARWGCRIKLAVGDQRRRMTQKVEVFRLSAGP